MKRLNKNYQVMAAKATGSSLQCTFVNCAKINKDAFDDGTFGIGPTGSEGAGVNVVEECVVPFQFCYNNPCCPSCEESTELGNYHRFKDCATNSNQNIWILLSEEEIASPNDVALYNGSCYYLDAENEIRSENILPSGAIYLTASDVQHRSCQACDPTTPPASCTAPVRAALPSTIVMTSIVLSADSAPCSSCTNIGTAAFDGIWALFSGSCTYFPQDENQSFDGKVIDAVANWVDLVAGPKWDCAIRCEQLGIGAHQIWRGEKLTGQTPVGTFNRVAGCDTTPSFTFE